MDYQDILQYTSEVARQAGSLLQTRFHRPIQHMTKSSVTDIVTEADQAAESYISEALLKRYPDYHLVGEEGGRQGAEADSAPYYWVVDPLDGTTNFASGIPHFCVSIALTDAQYDPILGIVYDPTRDELYTAIRGAGAHLNGSLLRVRQTQTLINAVVASGFPYDKHDNPDNNTARWAAMTRQVRGIRRMGSAALDLAYVAAGRLDGYWEQSLQLWDALAGMLLVTEAGGQVSDYEGNTRPQQGTDGCYVASNGYLHQAMLGILGQPSAAS